MAALHTAGRFGATQSVATSGAITTPSLAEVGWWLPLLAIPGTVFAARHRSQRAVVFALLGLAIQAAALALLANAQGAATPYMAIKMTYLAVYPLAVAALVTIAAANSGAIAWVFAVVATILAVVQLREVRRPAPIVSAELYAAGVWARTHLPRGCVDYLVGNEYTAYWLHIAVLRNPRLSARSSNDDLYRTETAFARWVDDGPLRYGIAKRSVLPPEVRERTRPLFTSGDAAVIERISSTPAAAVGTCDASQGRASP